MNFRQINLLNELESFMVATEEWKLKISSEIDEISAKMGGIAPTEAKRGPMPGLKALKDRVEALEKILNDLR